MNRISRGVVAKQRHKKVLKKAKGFYGARSRCFKSANQSVIKSLQYNYRDRKVRKRAMRALWIIRLNAAARQYSMTYSQLIHRLNMHNIVINRKILADMAVYNPQAFAHIAAKIAINP